MDFNLERLQEILKELSEYEKSGLDLSYLKAFVKKYKVFLEINDIKPDLSKLPQNKKLDMIEKFLQDKKVFPRIADIIDFVNLNLDLSFKLQNASREVTIQRIKKRIEKEPEIKQKLKATLSLILKEAKTPANKNIKNFSNSDDLIKWAEMLKSI